MTQEKVGFVGLGLMGHGMAKNIVTLPPGTISTSVSTAFAMSRRKACRTPASSNRARSPSLRNRSSSG